MNIINHFVAMIKQASQISNGRISRRDYWTYVLETILVIVILEILLLIFSQIDVIGVIFMIGFYVVSAFLSLVSFSLELQRIRDAKNSALYWLVGLIPIIGCVWILIILLKPSNVANINTKY